jgi:hypothetical protein
VTAGAVLAVLAVLSALAFAWGANRLIRHRAETASLDLSGVEGQIVFFSDSACRRCPGVREALSGLEVEEIRYGDDPDRFRATGAPAVPLVVIRDADGVEVGRIAGEVRSRQLRGLLRRAGL